jgi:integrase
VYYEYYCLNRTEEVPADYKEISFVCLRPDGCLELPTTLGTVCRKVAKTLEGFEGFHFHQLRHTYTSNLLANGAAPKDVQELLGHSVFLFDLFVVVRVIKFSVLHSIL